MALSGLGLRSTKEQLDVAERSHLLQIEERLLKVEKIFQDYEPISSGNIPVELSEEKSYIQNFYETHPFCRRKGLDTRVIFLADHLERHMQSQINENLRRSHLVEKRIQALEDENKSLREEITLLRQSVVDILEVLVVDKTRANLQESVTAATGGSETVQLRS